jgi:hypothetical protein
MPPKLTANSGARASAGGNPARAAAFGIDSGVLEVEP